MQKEKEITSLEKTVAFIEKWAIIFLVLVPYLFLSYKIIDVLAHPDPSTKYCGTGLYASILVHLFLALIAGLIIGLRLVFGKGFDIKTKFIIVLLLIIPLGISLFLFY